MYLSSLTIYFLIKVQTGSQAPLAQGGSVLVFQCAVDKMVVEKL